MIRPDFRVRAIVIKGLAWESGKSYPEALCRIGFTRKQGYHWSISVRGQGQCHIQPRGPVPF
jgi:hypothetical protein